MIGDRDFHHQQQAQPDLQFSIARAKANLSASDSTRAMGTPWQLRWTQGLSNRQSLVLELSLAGGNQTRIGRSGRFI